MDASRLVYPGAYVGCFATRKVKSGMETYYIECLLPANHEGDHDDLRDNGAYRWPKE